MDHAEAARELGVAVDAPFDDVRRAYRRLLRVTHPDVAGPATTERTARLTQAYAVLRRGFAEGTLPAAPPPPPPPPEPPRPPAGDDAEVYLSDADTIVVVAPAGETYARLLEAAHRIGEVTYVDRHAAILECIVVLSDGVSYSLVMSLQGRSHGTDVFCTLEPLERVGPASPEALAAVVDAIVSGL
jgi:hypothetical protein